MGFLDKFNIQTSKKSEKRDEEVSDQPEKQSELLSGDDFSVDDLYKLKSSDAILALDIGTEFVKAVIARQDSDKNLRLSARAEYARVKGICMLGRLLIFRA